MANKELAELYDDFIERLNEFGFETIEGCDNFFAEFQETLDEIKSKISILSEYQGEAVGYLMFFGNGDIGKFYKTEDELQDALRSYSSFNPYGQPVYLSAPIKKENDNGR